MAISSLIARGFGSFGNVNKIPTKGYGSAQVVINKIKLSFSGKVLTDLSISAKALTDLSLAGKLKNTVSLTGVLRNV